MSKHDPNWIYKLQIKQKINETTTERNGLQVQEEIFSTDLL